MNIYISFLQSKNNYPITGYSFWEYYVKNGIEESGNLWVESLEIDWVFPLSTTNEIEISKWKSNTWDIVLRDIKSNKIDLFLCYLYPSMIDESALLEIKKLGIPCVNFYCDNIRSFNHIPDNYKHFDLNWVPEFEALEMYNEKKYPHLLLPMPMWVPYELRKISNQEQYGTSFIGTSERSRILFFNKLFDEHPNLDISIYGNGWINEKDDKVSYSIYGDKNILRTIKNQIQLVGNYGFKSLINKLKKNKQVEISDNLKSKIHTSVTQNKYFELLKHSKIVLGLNRFDSIDHTDNNPNKYSRLRDIEAPMLGACYITEYVNGLEEFYDINNDILVFNDSNELVDKLHYLLGNKSLREKFRSNAQKKAIQSLSIPNSLSKIINHLNIK